MGLVRNLVGTLVGAALGAVGVVLIAPLVDRRVGHADEEFDVFVLWIGGGAFLGLFSQLIMQRLQ